MYIFEREVLLFRGLAWEYLSLYYCSKVCIFHQPRVCVCLSINFTWASSNKDRISQLKFEVCVKICSNLCTKMSGMRGPGQFIQHVWFYKHL